MGLALVPPPFTHRTAHTDCAQECGKLCFVGTIPLQHRVVPVEMFTRCPLSRHLCFHLATCKRWSTQLPHEHTINHCPASDVADSGRDRLRVAGLARGAYSWPGSFYFTQWFLFTIDFFSASSRRTAWPSITAPRTLGACPADIFCEPCVALISEMNRYFCPPPSSSPF